MTKKNEVAVVDQDTMALLSDSYPVDASGSRISLPRLGMVSQDKMEKVGKTVKLVAEAGTFFTERPTDEENENGKKVWSHDEVGTEIEGIILFQRKQLKMYDSNTSEFSSTPIYDNEDEVLPLFTNRAESARGTPRELKAKFEFIDPKSGKKKSKLEDNVVLYVQYEDDVYQLTLRGTSMYAFKKYSQGTLPPSVITVFNSESKENGSTAWNQMTFKAKRKLSQEEALEVLSKVKEIKDTVRAEKSQYASAERVDSNVISADEILNRM